MSTLKQDFGVFGQHYGNFFYTFPSILHQIKNI